MPEDLDNYVCKPDEVKLYVPLYNTDTGVFMGLQNLLAYIMVRGDENETFLSYDYDEDKSNILYSTFKQMFQGTSFKKNNPFLLNERSFQEFSTLFFYLPSTTDRKEKQISLSKMSLSTQAIVDTKILRNTLKIR